MRLEGDKRCPRVEEGAVGGPPSRDFFDGAKTVSVQNHEVVGCGADGGLPE